MKRIKVYVIFSIMVFVLSACGNKTEEEKNTIEVNEIENQDSATETVTGTGIMEELDTVEKTHIQLNLENIQEHLIQYTLLITQIIGVLLLRIVMHRKSL